MSTLSVRLAVLCVASVGLCFSLRAEDQPTTTSAPAKRDASQQFLIAGRTALSRTQYVQAVAALTRATEDDPYLLEAYSLLGKACALAGQKPEAVAAYRQVIRLAASDKDAVAADKFRADAEKQIVLLCPMLAQWDKLRLDYIQQLRKFVAEAQSSPACIEALWSAASLDSENTEAKSDLKDARERLKPPLPAEPASPDAAGAKILADSAAVLRKSGKLDQAIEQLLKACELCQDPPTLAALADAYQAADRKPQAVGVASYVLQTFKESEEETSHAARDRADEIVNKLDPFHVKFDSMASKFMTAGEALANRSLAGKDTTTAEIVIEAILKLEPLRDLARKLADKIGGRSSVPEAMLDFRGKYVKTNFSKGTEKAGPTVVTARSIEMKGTMWEGDGGPKQIVSFQNIAWGRSMRQKWRLEEVVAQPENPGNPYMNMRFFVGDFMPVAICGKRIVTPGYPQCPATFEEKDDKSVYREDRKYDVTIEKEGPILTSKVGGRLLWQGKLSPEQEKTLRSWAFQVVADYSYISKGEQYHLRLTLLEMSCSADCIKQTKR